jgi:hypothetical protein
MCKEEAAEFLNSYKSERFDGSSSAQEVPFNKKKILICKQLIRVLLGFFLSLMLIDI